MTATGTVIRDVRPEDVEGIVDIDAQRTRTPKLRYWKAILKQYARRESGRVALIADVDEGAIQGFLFGEVRAWEFGSERCGWIFSVAVRPEAERSGLATRLCEDAIRRFGSMGVGLVRTMVRRNDIPMLSLFRSMGFSAGPFSEMQLAMAPATGAEPPGAAVDGLAEGPAEGEHA